MFNQDKKKQIKKKYSSFIWLLVGLILIFIFYRQVGIGKIFSKLSFLRWWQFVLIFLIFFIGLFFPIKNWQLIIRDRGNFRPPLKKITKFWLISFAMTYLTPTGYFGGEPFRASSLESEYNYPFKEGLLVAIIDDVATFSGVAFFGFFGAILFFLKKEFDFGLLLSAWGLFILLTIFLSMKLWKKEKFFDYLFRLFFLHKIKVKTENGHTPLSDEIKDYGNQAIDYIHKFSPRFVLDCLYSFFFKLMRILPIILCLYFLGTTVSLRRIFFLGVMIDMFRMAPLPAGLGSFEASYLLTFSIFGLNLEVALALSFLMRALDLATAGLGLLFNTHHTVKLLKEGN